ncbi:EAL domain-containing protein [Rhodoferax sp.]|uniref:EAL domain-containing response regulator n=1 Tax=Rhodoferax sp. TaxID=50421 RepID=UPI0026376F90|nr:EAL domain-containing protein [Rhodoferax sp.]MDD5480539.1 EAL domain-containing protein [Rhodoferax sp.]
MPHSPNLQPRLARILIVDDHPLVLAGLVTMVELTGHQITTAESGLEAVRQLNDSPFDLVLLDLLLPDISGLEVMDYLQQQHIDTTVVVISGLSDIDHAIGALQRGAFDFLRKSFPAAELLKTIDHALQRRWLVQDNQRLSAQLLTSEKVHNYLIENSPDIIYTLNEQGLFTDVNPRVLPLLGWTAQELIGQHYSVLIHPDDLSRADYVLNHCGHNFQITRLVELHMRARQPDGGVRLFSHELMRVAQPGVCADALLTQPGWRTYGIAHDLTERKRVDALISYQTTHDLLTGLPNRALFKDRLNLTLQRAQRHGQVAAVLVLDIDRFKLINDALGHDLGDALLVQIAQRLKGCLRASDTLSRLGADEFTILLTDLGAPEEAAQLAEKCQASLRQPFTLQSQVAHVSVSMGLALYPTHGNETELLIQRANAAMTHKKTHGKDGYVVFEAAMLPLDQQLMTLEHELHEALRQGELEMFYQPQVDAASQRIVGAEALMRWNHPQRGLLSPAAFLPLAEETGLIIPMTDWLLQAVTTDLCAFNHVSEVPLRMSINLPPQYLDRSNFTHNLHAALLSHDLLAAQFEVEVTENICIRNPLNAIEQLNALRHTGVRVAIDDFGTGYSSLSYLQQLPLDTLKIDRSFVMTIPLSGELPPVVLAIISVAKGLNLHLVAEGVETSTQLHALAQAGCHTIQGFYFFKPMSCQALLAQLGSGKE